jgi:uncharacterized membrane protein YraQ (UPF0718 family)/regulator of protease activity HflC (stomatin/prohibitin superfamily)
LTAAVLDAFTRFFDFLWQSFLLLAPMLLLGLLLGGLIHVFISREAILRWLRHDSLKSVSTSAAIGVPVPLCSCSVVPVVAEMRRKGASRSSCMSFLITAPETGADSILVTNAFFGFAAAVIRPVISFITAVVAGIFCIGLIRDDRDEATARTPHHEHGHDHDHGHGHDHDHDHGVHRPLIPGEEDCYISPPELKEASVRWLKGFVVAVSRWKSASWIKPDFYRAELLADGGAAGTDVVEAPAERRLPSFRTIVSHIFRYGFVEIADDILFALLVGIALGGVLYLVIPSDMMANEYARWISYPVMVLVGVPLYICASASTPIAAALVAKGVSPGAALIFLMTGPATNTGTIAIIMNQFGVRFASVYVGVVIVVTVILGILVDVLLLATGFSVTVNLQASDSPTLLFLQWAGALLLLALIIWRFRAGALKSGWDDMLLNVRPVFRRWGLVWGRMTRSFAGREDAAPRGYPWLSFLRVLSPATPAGIALYVLALALFVGTGFTTVPPGSVGYGRLFGQVWWRDLPPGLHYLAPRPFVQIDKWPIREVKSVLTPYEYVSGDLNLLAIDVNVQYRVRDPYVYHYRVSNAQRIIEDGIRDHVRAFISARGLEPLLNVNRADLENDLRGMFETADGGAIPALRSVELVKVNLLAVRPASETLSAFREVSSAQEDRERIIVNAQRFLVSLIPRAHGNAEYEVKQAEGEAYKNVVRADAEAGAISVVAAAVRSAPEVLRNMLWREKLEIALSRNPKIIVPNQDSLGKVALWKRKSSAGDGHMRPAHGKNGPADGMDHRNGAAGEKRPEESAKSTTPGEKDKQKGSTGAQNHAEKSGDKGKPEESRKLASAQGKGNAKPEKPEKSGGEAK